MIRDERAVEAYRLRETGKTLKEVGICLGISGTRARELIQKEAWRLSRDPHWTDGLSTRVCQWLWYTDERWETPFFNNKEKLIEAIKSGYFSIPKTHENELKMINMGKKGFEELILHLGMDHPEDFLRKKRLDKMISTLESHGYKVTKGEEL